jgi:hypothetical protein
VDARAYRLTPEQARRRAGTIEAAYRYHNGRIVQRFRNLPGSAAGLPPYGGSETRLSDRRFSTSLIALASNPIPCAIRARRSRLPTRPFKPR